MAAYEPHYRSGMKRVTSIRIEVTDFKNQPRLITTQVGTFVPIKRKMIHTQIEALQQKSTRRAYILVKKVLKELK